MHITYHSCVLHCTRNLRNLQTNLFEETNERGINQMYFVLYLHKPSACYILHINGQEQCIKIYALQRMLLHRGGYYTIVKDSTR